MAYDSDNNKYTIDEYRIPFAVGYTSDEEKALDTMDENELYKPYFKFGSQSANQAGAYSFQAGIETCASGTYSAVVGGGDGTASGRLSAVIGGLGGTASGNDSAVIGGLGGTASGENSVVIGGSSGTASGENSVVIGAGKKINSGYENTASKKRSVIIGGYENEIIANGDDAVVVGGHGNKATASDQVVMGKFNDFETTNALIIGNGTDENNRSNALTVDWSGNITAGELNGVDVAALETTVSGHTTDISNLQTTVSGHTTDISILQTTVTGQITYASGWTAYDTEQAPTLRKCGNIVSLTGAVKPTTAVTPGVTGNGNLIMTLPDDFAPPQRTLQICQGSGARKWLLNILADGKVYCGRYGTTTGTETIAADTWLPFHCTWILD